MQGELSAEFEAAMWHGLVYTQNNVLLLWEGVLVIGSHEWKQTGVQESCPVSRGDTVVLARTKLAVKIENGWMALSWRQMDRASDGLNVNTHENERDEDEPKDETEELK